MYYPNVKFEKISSSNTLSMNICLENPDATGLLTLNISAHYVSDYNKEYNWKYSILRLSSIIWSYPC